MDFRVDAVEVGADAEEEKSLGRMGELCL